MRGLRQTGSVWCRLFWLYKAWGDRLADWFEIFVIFMTAYDFFEQCSQIFFKLSWPHISFLSSAVKNLPNFHPHVSFSNTEPLLPFPFTHSQFDVSPIFSKLAQKGEFTRRTAGSLIRNWPPLVGFPYAFHKAEPWKYSYNSTIQK